MFRSAAERFFKVKIYRMTPRGVDPAADLHRAFPGFRVATVFDIGANVGQSVDRFLTEFPDAGIRSFEPSRSTFEQLQAQFRGEPRVSCFNYALSDHAGTSDMEHTEKSDLRRLVAEKTDGEQPEAVESVVLTTLDAFCEEQGVVRIDYLKIDTEGHELQVLTGASRMLDSDAIAILELELGMNPDNHRHTRFEDAKAALEDKGYRVFAITEQTAEFPMNQPHLRRVNAVFVSAALIEPRAEPVPRLTK